MKINMKLFVITLLCFLMAVSFAEAAQKAKISIARGRVEVKIEKNVWQKARIGQVLSERSVIRTGKGSYANLILEGGSKIRIEENSELGIKTMGIKNKAKVSVFNLISGKIFSVVNKLAKKDVFNIETPTAVAGVRGTGLGMQNINNIVKVDVAWGFVEMWDPRDEEKRIMIRANQGASYDGEEFPDIPGRINRNVLFNLKNVLANIDLPLEKFNLNKNQDVVKLLLRGREKALDVLEKLIAKRERVEQRRIDLMELRRDRTDFIDIAQNNLVNNNLRDRLQRMGCTKLLFSIKGNIYKGTYFDGAGTRIQTDTITFNQNGTVNLHMDNPGLNIDRNYTGTEGGTTFNNAIYAVLGLVLELQELDMAAGNKYDVINGDMSITENEEFASWEWVGTAPANFDHGLAKITFSSGRTYITIAYNDGGV